MHSPPYAYDMTCSELDRRHIWHPYTQADTAPPPLEIVRGDGAWLYDASGRRFLDLISSWWVNLHGHAHPHVAQAIARQAESLEQVIFADFTHAPAATLAGRLCALTGLDRVFFSDDGSTAVEVALKAAIQYWRNQGETRRCGLVALEGAYHGDTFGAMSVGAGSGYFDHFRSLMTPAELLPYPATWDGDPKAERKETEALAAADRLFHDHGDTIAAVILEPLVQGASGMRVSRPGFVRALSEKARAAGALVIYDEAMTGFGRTGTMFAMERCGFHPDFLILSKGLTAGFLPMSATLCREAVYEAFRGPAFARALAHGHSFTANPLGCAAANASLDLFESERSLEKVAAIETVHRQGMAMLARVPGVVRPRVLGDLAAFELATPTPGYDAEIGRRLKVHFYEMGLLIRPMGSCVYLLPPYCVTASDLLLAYQAAERGLDSIGVQ